MRKRRAMVGALVLLAGTAVSCSRQTAKDVVIREFPCDTLEGVIHRTGIVLDSKTKKEGKAALRIDVVEPTVVRLFEAGNTDIEAAILVYQAKVRTEGVQGRVYLEMWCHFEGKGEFFSRSLDAVLGGTTKWTQLEIPYPLKLGEKPDKVKLNLVCEGTGDVWVDDVRLVKRIDQGA